MTDLFSTPSLVPMKNDSLENQMNATTRIVILTFILCALMNIYLDFRFLLGAIFLIILAYYSVKAFQPIRETKEHYGFVESVVEPPAPVAWNQGTNEMVFSCGPTSPRRPCGPLERTQDSFTLPTNAGNAQLINADQSLAWCPQNIPLQTTISDNQRLVGPPNPKTLVRPVIPTPIYDFEVWKPNDFIIPTGINDQRRQELFDNGYVPISRIATDQPRQRNNDGRSLPTTKIPIEQVQAEIQENYQSPRDPSNPYKEFTYPSIDRACGYDPSNLEYNLPINYRANACQKTEKMKQYNEDLFTIPLQPGLYTKSQVNQPYASQSNLGISMTQPFLPTTFQKKNGYDEFIENAHPVPTQEVPVSSPDAPLRTEIYDPRLTGYGTSYRSYIEPVTGQARFYYDDIDQQTQYNYITRNNVDFAAFGTRTGPFDHRSLEGDALTGYADQTYTDSQVTFRNEMQQRLMHKNSNREWQQRVAPISTMNRARASGGKASTGSYAGPRG